jgi:hypothetical protein
MDFSTALHELNKGNRLTNTEWSLKEQYIVKMPGYPEGVPANRQTQEAHHLPDDSEVVVSPYIVMMRKGVVFPWTPSNADLFSLGWEHYYSPEEVENFRNSGALEYSKLEYCANYHNKPRSVSDWPHP